MKGENRREQEKVAEKERELRRKGNNEKEGMRNALIVKFKSAKQII